MQLIAFCFLFVSDFGQPLVLFKMVIGDRLFCMEINLLIVISEPGLFGIGCCSEILMSLNVGDSNGSGWSAFDADAQQLPQCIEPTTNEMAICRIPQGLLYQIYKSLASV